MSDAIRCESYCFSTGFCLNEFEWQRDDDDDHVIVGALQVLTAGRGGLQRVMVVEILP